MNLFDVLTLVSAGTLVGNELTVSVFLNPALERCADTVSLPVTSMLGKSLGRAMPFWYVGVQVMLGVEAYLRRGHAEHALLMGATALWAAVIAATLLWLVPLNNRIVARDADWKALLRRWDARHRVRVAALLVALAAATFALGAAAA